MLASLTQRTQHAYGAGNGDAWPPVKAIGTTIFKSGEVGAQADYWWYSSYNGVKSFNLDNDSGWCWTFFAAGYDNSGALGVDSTDTGCHKPQDQNALTKSLYLYAR